jgi:hypothetical protein
MNRVGTALFRRLDDSLADEVALTRGRRADVDRLVGLTRMYRACVRVTEHRHGPDAQLPACAHDSYGNLAAVGDEHFSQRMLRLRFSGLGHGA